MSTTNRIEVREDEMIQSEVTEQKRPRRRIRGRLSDAAQREALVKSRTIELMSTGWHGGHIAAEITQSRRTERALGGGFDRWAANYPDYARLTMGTAPGDPIVFADDAGFGVDDGIDPEDDAARFLERFQPPSRQ